MISSIFGGGGGKSQSTSTPTNMQNPAFTAIAPQTASGITSLQGGAAPFLGINSAFAPNVGTGGINTNFDLNNNPFVAPLTAGQTGLVNQVTGQGMPNAGTNNANNWLSQVLNPSYPATLATSPITQQAVSAAINPMVSAFQNTTIPGLAGQFTAAGQSINPNATAANPQGGSSAFNKAYGVAQTGLDQAMASAASNIENSAFQTGLGQQTTAAESAPSIQGQEINNTLNSLTGASLPQLVQQQGIQTALQTWQQRVQTMLTALGLGGQVAQPVVGNTQSSSGNFSQNPDIASGFGNVLSGAANFFGSGANGGPSPFANLLRVF